MVGCFAWALRCVQRASDGTQKDILGAVLVRVLRISALFPFALEEDVPLLEGIGDVFQKNYSKDDMLVFGGIHTAAQGVGHTPQIGLIAGRRATGARISAVLGLRILRSSSGHTSSFLNLQIPTPVSVRLSSPSSQIDR